ncbi:MAG: HD domain-containing protein [Halobacteriaceae archaeon]
MSARGMYEAVDHVRDPIHGFIGLSEYELAILDNTPVQQLREISQLGVTRFVYPSATHSRFEHSLGVMHLAGRLANSLDLADETVTAARIAGLLHDTGHGPFSHTSESIAERHGLSHEELSCEVVDQCSEHIPLSTDLVKEYVQSDAQPNIVAGVLDADRMDYLVRDSHYTGVAHGVIDVETLLQYATTTPDGRLGLSHKAVPALNELISARLKMYKTIYTHSTIQVMDTMLRRVLADYSHEHGVRELMAQDEQSLYTYLTSHPLYRQYRNRNLYEQISNGKTSSDEKPLYRYIEEQNPYQVAEEIATKAGVATNDVLVREPMSTGSSLPSVPILTAEGGVTPLHKVSNLPAHVQTEFEENTSTTVYAHPDVQNVVNTAVKNLF